MRIKPIPDQVRFASIKSLHNKFRRTFDLCFMRSVCSIYRSRTSSSPVLILNERFTREVHFSLPIAVCEQASERFPVISQNLIACFTIATSLTMRFQNTVVVSGRYRKDFSVSATAFSSRKVENMYFSSTFHRANTVHLGIFICSLDAHY